MAQVQRYGFYAFEFKDKVSPFLGKLLFIDEKSSTLKKTLVSVAKALPDAHKIEWNLFDLTDSKSTLTAAVTAGATSITVADGSKFRKGQEIAIGTMGDTAREVVVITDVSGNTLTVTTVANAHNAGDPVAGIGYSKLAKAALDVAGDRWTQTPEWNYLQKFGAVISIDFDDLSVFDPAVVAATYPSVAKALQDGMLDAEAIRALKIRMKVEQSLVADVFGDVERTFFEGVRMVVGDRYFAGGLADFGQTSIQDWSALSTDELKFKYIVSKLYEAYAAATKLGATVPAIIGNNKFVEKFLQLLPQNYVSDKMPEEDGYRLHRIRLVDKVFDVYASAYLDVFTADNEAVAYVVPLDSVAFKTRPVKGVKAIGTNISAIAGSPDVVITKDPTLEAQTNDATAYNVFFE